MTRFALALVLLAPAAARADVRDPAELFPQSALAYAELSGPRAVAQWLGELFGRTPFADAVREAHDRLDKAADPRKHAGTLHAARFGLLASPEALAELAKLRGAAVGLVGFTDTGTPKVAAAVLTADTPALGLLARQYVTTTPNLRRVATAAGVPVFQFRAVVGPVTDANGQPFGPDDADNPLRGHKLLPGTAEPTFAYAPGLFVIGNDPDAVGDVVKRFAGKAASPSLLAEKAFRTSTRAIPGVHFWGRPRDLFAAFDAATKGPGRDEPTGFAWVRFVLNPKAVPLVSGNLAVGTDEATLSLGFVRDGTVPSPLLDVIGTDPVPANWTASFAPGFAAGGAWSLPPAGKRAAAVLALADAVSAALGTVGASPSERAKAVRGADVVDLLGRAAGVSVAGPAVVLHLDDEAAAGAWAAVLPELMRAFTGADTAPTPAAETIAGVKVIGLAADDRPGGRVYFARVGRAVVIGGDPKGVAAAATGANPPLSPGPDAVGVGLVRPGTLANWLAPTGVDRPPAPAGPTGPVAPRPAFLPGSGVPAPPPPGPSPQKLVSAAGRLPAVAVTVTRPADGVVTIEFRVRDLAKPLAAAAADVWDWLEQAAPADGTGNPGLLPPLVIDSFGR